MSSVLGPLERTQTRGVQCKTFESKVPNQNTSKDRYKFEMGAALDAGLLIVMGSGHSRNLSS